MAINVKLVNVSHDTSVSSKQKDTYLDAKKCYGYRSLTSHKTTAS